VPAGPANRAVTVPALVAVLLAGLHPAASGPAPDVASVIALQTKAGGWPKAGRDGRATIDNGATTREMRLLARAVAEGGGRACRDSFLKGLDWLLKAQYPSGGWPQVFPLAGKYHDRITFNDDAMVNVLELLRDIARGEDEFAFVDARRRAASAGAVRLGVDCILRCQVHVGGARTVWCQQHDEMDFGPRPGRAFEPVALASAESVKVVRFLMREPFSPEVAAAIESACAWFAKARLPDGRWARFCEVESGRPIFCGRDGVIKYRVEDIEEERRNGYSWFNDRPARLISRELPKWRERIGERAGNR
jgi:hypothetical protein